MCKRAHHKERPSTLTALLGHMAYLSWVTAFRGFSHKELKMNIDQVKGTLKDAAGKVQEKFGELIDSPEQEAKGIAKQVEGTAQKKVGDLKEAIHDASEK